MAAGGPPNYLKHLQTISLVTISRPFAMQHAFVWTLTALATKLYKAQSFNLSLFCVLSSSIFEYLTGRNMCQHPCK